MQTFLPYASFEKSAACLDYRRLGKQRVEAKQLLNAISPGYDKGWKNHPAARMWRGYSPALSHYMNVCILEWMKRGYKNNMKLAFIDEEVIMPDWIGGAIHESHKGNLLRKDPIFYGKYNWNVCSLIPYYWPR